MLSTSKVRIRCYMDPEFCEWKENDQFACVRTILFTCKLTYAHKHEIFYTQMSFPAGRTCLHLLAHSASNACAKKVQWNERNQTAKEAWLSLARILVEAGGNPSLPDLAGKFPHEVAWDKGKLDLHEIFSEVCEGVCHAQGFEIHFPLIVGLNIVFMNRGINMYICLKVNDFFGIRCPKIE